MGETIMGAQNADPVEQDMDLTVYKALGKLIKYWSTNDPTYIGEDNHPIAEPTTGEHLRAALVKLGAGATIPPGITKVTLVRYGENELVLRVPPADLIKRTETKLKQGGAYTIPDFYLETPIKGSQASDSEKAKLDLHAKRIGDYTIAHCE